MSQTNGRDATANLFTIMACGLVVAAFYFGKEILLPCSLAVFLSFILNPLVRKLEQLRVPRGPAVISVVLASCLSLGSVGWLVANQTIELGQMLPLYKGNLIQKVRVVKGATSGKLEKATDAIQEIGDELADPASKLADRGADGELKLKDSSAVPRRGLWERITNGIGDRVAPQKDALEVKVVSLPPSPLQQVQSWLGPLVAPLTTAGIVLVLTLFLLWNREDMRNRVFQLIGTAHLRTTTEALDDATRRVSSLLQMQLVINAIYGLCVGIGLQLIGVPNALLWGVLGLLLRFLPYVGPWIVAALPITLSMAVFNDWSHVLMTVALFVVLELVVNNVLEPWLYGASTGVSSVGIIVAAIFWTWLWGPIGLVLAMPFTVCLVVAGKYVPQLRFITVLLGDRSALTAEERLYQRLLAQDDEEADLLIAEVLQKEAYFSLLDDVFVPTLYLIERDRHAGVLSAPQQQAMFEAIREAIEEHGSSAAAPEIDTGGTHTRVLCVTARDEADAITAAMFCQMLGEQSNIACDVTSDKMLAGEVVEQAVNADVVLIAALPPAATRHARYLCKRLRSRYEHLPIVVGLWGSKQMDRSRKRLEAAGATRVASTLAEAQRIVRSLIRLKRQRQLEGQQGKQNEDATLQAGGA